MRSSVIIASFIALAAALPAINPVDEASLAVRTESLDTTVAFDPRQVGFNESNQTFSWPVSEIYSDGMSAQFQVTNLGNGNYKFQFWSSAPPNGGALNFRVSSGGKTLASVNLNPRTNSITNIAKTGDNFNVAIKLA